jgi:hypothetical protein
MKSEIKAFDVNFYPNNKIEKLTELTRNKKKLASYSNKSIYAPGESAIGVFKKVSYFELYDNMLLQIDILEVDLFEFIDMANGRQNPYLFFLQFSKWDKHNNKFTL